LCVTDTVRVALPLQCSPQENASPAETKLDKMKHSKAILFLVFFSVFFDNNVFGQMKTESFEFVHDGKKLSGLLDLPTEQKPTSIVLIVQGSGKSNIVAGNWYYDLRSNFARLGIACCIWDKPGCGKSEGVFDIDQTVQSSANEVIAAIKELKQRKTEGADKIGLWGISRAGWICPLVMQQYPSIAYWISVSGTDDKENFGYLLETNFRIEGRSEVQTKLLVAEWQHGNDVFRKRGTFSEYQAATQNLRKDSFWLSISGPPYTEEGYLLSQKKFISEHHEFDEKTGLMIYVPHFVNTLEKINCPVLAIFGEKDANVNWRKTIALYKETIGKKSKAGLTIKSFPDCNHNIQKCKTGGMREANENQNKYVPPCDGYFNTMSAWLRENGFGK
jgi:predicted acyl esterase